MLASSVGCHTPLKPRLNTTNSASTIAAPSAAIANDFTAARRTPNRQTHNSASDGPNVQRAVRRQIAAANSAPTANTRRCALGPTKIAIADNKHPPASVCSKIVHAYRLTDVAKPTPRTASAATGPLPVTCAVIRAVATSMIASPTRDSNHTHANPPAR